MPLKIERRGKSTLDDGHGAPPGSPNWYVDGDGWMVAGDASPIERIASPNADERPDAEAPSLIVVHSISLPPGEFGGRCIDALFTNTLDHDAHPYFDRLRGLCVSAHLLVRRDGTVAQFVSCGRRAWHAGVSSFRGRVRCNDFSIGIELEGDDTSAFAAPQYNALLTLIAALAARYPIATIVAHSEIAPGRKTDPGPGFDWARVTDAMGAGVRAGVSAEGA